MKNKDTEIKVMFVGETDTGKTSIFNRLINNEFTEKISASIGIDFGEKQFKYGKKNYSLHLFDAAGQQRFRSIINNFYNKMQGFFIVFDLTNENSLNEVKNWVDTIQDNCGVEVPIVLLGNKKDLKEKRMNENILNEKLADLVKTFNYYEISAKKNSNIQDAIKNMIDLIENKTPEYNIKDNPEDKVEENTKINVNEKSGSNFKENIKCNVNDNTTGNANEQPKKNCCPCSRSCS